MSGYTREQLERSLAEFGVPEHLRDGLVEYVLTGRPTGGFLTACLRNDFLDAVCRAGSDLNLGHLQAIAKWLYNETPRKCWGSPAKVKAWEGL